MDTFPNSGGALQLSMHEQAQRYLRSAWADNTRRAYRSDWEEFAMWCQTQGASSLPAAPETVALYFTVLSNRLKVSTLMRHLSALNQMHRLAGYPPPGQASLVRQILSGIRRERGTPPSAKRPLSVRDLQAILALLPSNLLGLRDRALLLLGFSGAFRRAELISLDCAELQIQPQGLVVTLRRGKTDTEGHGRTVGIPYGLAAQTCPVRSIQTWQEAAGISTGPLFRQVNKHGQVMQKRLSGEAVGLVVKRWVRQLGYEPVFYGGHSLRAGLATAAAMAGKSERVIMQQTGHRSLITLRRYIRDGNLFRENAAGELGL